MRKNLIKTLIIFALLIWSGWKLYPTIKMEMLSDAEIEQLKLDGKFDELNNKAIKRGLDLQGGIYLVLEVDLAQLAVDLCNKKDAQFYQIIDECKTILRNEPEANFFAVLQNSFQEKNLSLNRYYGTRLDSDDDILQNMREEAEDAIDRSREILWNRVDEFGVSEPNIQKQGSRRILVELPGIQEIQRAKALINQTALLEFKMLVDGDIAVDVYRKIDKAFKQKRGPVGVNPDTVITKTDSTAQSVADSSKSDVIRAEDLFGSSSGLADSALADSSVLSVDSEIFSENPFLSLLFDNRGSGGTGEVGVLENNKFAVEKILADPDIQKIIPVDAGFLWSNDAEPGQDQPYYTLYLVKKEPELTGKYLTDASVQIGGGGNFQSSGKPEVHFTLDSEGTRIFSRVTGANVNKFMAIVLDGKVYSSPRINTKITRGNPYIEGMGDMKEAQEIAIVLRAGALPAPIEIIEERTVGPSLGADSIKKGTQSAVMGLLVVVIFMVFYYRMSGIIADIALIMNLFIILAVLAGFQFTLTLPGVAGIILTIGMAVDANVLIFERIREEMRSGKTVRAAIDNGYAKALTAILDANITTLFTAAVLYQFGTGPIRGFALTLFIGILTSLFTALIVTRSIFDFLTTRFAFKKLSI